MSDKSARHYYGTLSNSYIYLILLALVSIVSACSSQRNSVNISYDVPAQLGLELDDISVEGFYSSVGRSSHSNQLADLVSDKLNANPFIRITSGSSHQLVGSVSVSKLTTDSSEGDDPGHAENCVINKRGSISGHYSIQSSSGQSLKSDTFTIGIDGEGKAENCTAASTKLPTDDTLIQNALEIAAERIAQGVSLHTVTTTEDFLTANEGNNQLGIDFYNDGLFDNAMQMWTLVANLSKELPATRAAALHNMAIAYELQGNIDSALVKMQEANETSPEAETHQVALERLVRRQKLGTN